MKTIIPDNLIQLLPLLPDIPTASVSEMRFSALGRIYISLYKLVADNSLDEEYGTRAHYERRIRALIDTGWRSYGTLSDIETRGRMLHMLFSLTYEPFAVAEERDEEACIHAAETLIEEYLAAESPESPMCRPIPGPDPRGLADTMRCAADLVNPGMIRKERYKRWFQRHIAAWAATLDGNGIWPRLPYADALRRIGLMNRDSYMFPGSPHDTRIRKAYEHYRLEVDVPQHPEELDRERLRDLGLLYEVAIQGNVWKPDPARTERIIDFLRKAVAPLPPEDDMWIYALAFVVHNLCERIDKRIQLETSRPESVAGTEHSENDR